MRYSDEVASNLVLWKPLHGKPNRGRKRKKENLARVGARPK